MATRDKASSKFWTVVFNAFLILHGLLVSREPCRKIPRRNFLQNAAASLTGTVIASSVSLMPQSNVDRNAELGCLPALIQSAVLCGLNHISFGYKPAQRINNSLRRSNFILAVFGSHSTLISPRAIYASWPLRHFADYRRTCSLRWLECHLILASDIDAFSQMPAPFPESRQQPAPEACRFCGKEKVRSLWLWQCAKSNENARFRLQHTPFRFFIGF